MKLLRRASGLFSITLLIFLIQGCTGGNNNPAQGAVGDVAGDEIYAGLEQTTNPDVLFSDEPDKFIDSVLNSMSLNDKVSQMMFPALQPGMQTKDWIENRHLKKYKPGGFVLFGAGLMKTAKVIRELQAESKIPLLFAEDFERGIAMRINGTRTYPLNMALAAAGSPLLVYEMGKRIATDSKILGVHWNLSPVVDVNNNPGNPIINVRSFGESPEMDGELGIMMSKGLQAGGILSSLKHFPGHGNTTVDSHSDLPVIHGDSVSFMNTEIYPFRKAIEKGAYSVMVGHLGVDAFNTADTPACLSYNIVTKLLKEELGFKGIINTDALTMKAVSKYYKPGVAALLAVKAGVDVLMASPESVLAIDAIVNAVKKGEISTERIDHSVRKILQAKKWLGLFDSKPAPYSDVEKLLRQNEIDEVSKDIAIRSITLLKNDHSIFPLKKNQKYLHIVLRDGRDYPNYKRFITAIEERNSSIDSYDFPLKPDDSDLDIYKEKISGYSGVIVSVYLQTRQSSGRIQLSKESVDLIKSLKKKGKKVILLAHCHPYVLMDVPEVDVFVTNYGAELSSEFALAAAIFGENNISGKLPVSLPGTQFKAGDGIDLLKENGKVLGQSEIYRRIDELVESGIKDSIFPGAALTIIKDGKIYYENAYGRFTYDATSPAVRVNSLFDIASLTKVTTTTFAIMKLYEEGKIKLDSKVADYLPAFKDKPSVTVRSILLHTSGLPASKIYYKLGLKGDEIINDICNTPLEYPTGTKTVYSDLGMIILAKVIEKITGEKFSDYIRRILWIPAGMTMTMYNPEEVDQPYCVPTEIDNYLRNKLIQGSVHDENCFLLGGVSGHAGVFSTVHDISRYMMILLGGGTLEGERFLRPETISMFIKRGGGNSSRALGWDTNFKNQGLGGKSFPEYSFGHTGFTGTSIWADPVQKFALILFTNRVYPSRAKEGMRGFRLRIHEAVASLLLHK